MALWHCAECTTAYSVGAPKCPQCGSTVRVNEATQPPEEEQDMAKVTVHGGASDAFADEQEGGEVVSAGSSSSTSPEKPSSSPEQSETPDPSPAPKTASRSAKGRTGSRTARGTDGDQTEATSETSSADGK
jgi:hypothetical protein